MDSETILSYTGIILLIAFLGIAFLFLHYEQKTFELIQPEHRLMRPSQVWLQLIPLYGLVWQFFVIRRLSDSIRNQLNAPTGDELFAEQFNLTVRPVYTIGMAYAVLFCCGILPLPLLRGLTNLAGLVCWILYWIQLGKYRKLLQERALLGANR